MCIFLLYWMFFNQRFNNLHINLCCIKLPGIYFDVGIFYILLTIFWLIYLFCLFQPNQIISFLINIFNIYSVQYIPYDMLSFYNHLYMSLTKIKSPRILMIFFYPKTDRNPLFGSQRDSLKICIFFQCQVFVLDPSKVAWQIIMQFKVISQHISTSSRAFILILIHTCYCYKIQHFFPKK